MRGKVRFTVGEAEHVLHFTINRLCDLEDETGESVMHYAEALGKPGAMCAAGGGSAGAAPRQRPGTSCRKSGCSGRSP